MAPRPESLKKVIDVLGDFNPSEDKIKKTLGIGEDELKMVKEESVNNQVIKERHPINKRDTKKAQSTLGLNLSKEKLMDVFGVDEDTITEASAEENEIQEIKIKRLRENITLSNKRALKKALMIMGCDPSSSKIMRTLGNSMEFTEQQPTIIITQ
ncbi:hypothetical protein DFA_08150 [Cavenderia fasciculata]|uniref:Uncharacterized protein n=1 Tax=Cavenderia fasciculata TaxID=261658 RepID=F4Q5A7_CACFS|nr:uncharacterized protein DFA_08150 [Cavenderia fasciculata]EGG17166.1 hypothetical protein DFA_08150 [Cavenderia fasciculata]|eukprot:XP_004355650.1 hypothetical protein DFA_08150 [Cavenderia fasciculata]